MTNSIELLDMHTFHESEAANHAPDMTKPIISLRSRYVTNDDFYTHPAWVKIDLPVVLVQKLKQSLEFMESNQLYQVLINDVHFSHDFEDDDGEPFDDYFEIKGCYLRLDDSGYVRFIFPIRHSNNEGWTEDVWRIAELERSIAEISL